MNRNSSYVLGLIALIMVSVSCVFFVFYRAGGGRESRSKTVRYAGCLGKLLFAASVILLSVSVLNGFAKGEGFRENLEDNSSVCQECRAAYPPDSQCCAHVCDPQCGGS